MKLALLLAAAAIAACKPAAAPAPSAASADKPAERAPGSAAIAVPPGRSDERCLQPLESPAALKPLLPRKGRLVLGVVAGLKDASEENLTHLRKLLAELRARGAEALVADGDLGDSSDEQEVLLGVLAQTGLPILAMPGNREVRSDLDAAEENLRKRGAIVYDLAHTRVVDLGDALLIGLPGAFDRRQLRAEGGCVYGPRDLEALQSYLSRLPTTAPPALLVAAVPPKGSDARALDVSDGVNVGDPRLANLISQPRRVPFGIFGQVWEAGGRAIDSAGKPLAERAPSEQLYLNPGAAEHTPWPMSDGSNVSGQAAVLTIEGRKASFEMVRPAPPPAPPGTDRKG